MPSFERNRLPDRLTAVLLAGLLLALAGLVISFVVSFNLADRQNRLANLAERQAGAVEEIAELGEARVGRSSLSKALSRYRELIRQETALLADDPSISQRQRHETEDAARLEGLALFSADTPAFGELATAISRREGEEVAAARLELERLHTRTVTLATALAGVGLLCALSAALLLIRRNQSLKAIVQARTARLEEVDRSRRLFFAKASHELRTPVTAMRGEAEVALLAGNANVEHLRQSLDHIRANATFLSHRIDELLGLASADDGKLQLDFVRLDLARLIADAVDEAQPCARSVEVQIDLAAPESHAAVLGDKRWLHQALLTVIDNGLKFSPMGGTLTIAVKVENGNAAITVTDNGQGVMPDDLPRIFDAYYQSKQGRQRGGNGLGLALARWVFEQHNGAIDAANMPQGGCRISIRLPLETVT